MKEERKHNIDKLFLNALGGDKIEPSTGVWESLSTHIPSKGGQGVILYFISALAIGAFVFLMHSTLVRPEEQVVAVSNLQEAEIQINNSTSSIPTTDINDLTSPGTEEVGTASSSKASDLTNSTKPTTSSSLGTIPVSPNARAAKPEAYAENKLPVRSESDDQIEGDDDGWDYNNSYFYMEKVVLIPGQLTAPSGKERMESSPREIGEAVLDLTFKDSYVRKAEVLFGVNLSPAVNIYPDRQNRNDYSLEFVSAVEKSRFIIESGIGGNYTTESVKYQITYSTYDSVGYYIGVTGFTVDPQNPDSVRFETSLKSVYDSINHFNIQENTNKFAYLQIPLRIGYRVIQKDRFSLDLKLGVLFSVQIYKEVPAVPYRGSDGEKIEVIRQYPDRLLTNWQYTAGLGINYQINNKLRFTIEPFYRQYLKSVYSTGSAYSARSPYGFGIRGGLYFHF